MTLFIQEIKTEDVLFQTNDAFAVPAVGEELKVNHCWYRVVKRNFYYKGLEYIHDNSVTLWVEEI